MKTATQLFPSSYLQPNNIDWIVGILQKKNFGKIYDFMFVLFIIIHFPYRKKSSSGNFCGVWAFRLQWEFYFFSEMLFEKKRGKKKKFFSNSFLCVHHAQHRGKLCGAKLFTSYNSMRMNFPNATSFGLKISLLFF